jgi:NhaP-type Na+/H+ or K+/H+ antiporter
MTIEAIWFLLIGGLLILMAISSGLISNLPMTGAMVYLVVGFFVGPAGAGLLKPDMYGDVHVLRLMTEAGLVISLFAIGMHLRMPLGSRLWLLPLSLASVGMLLTVALMMAFGHYVLGLGAGVALVLAAALAPTDPVLANELRPEKAGDDEPLRFALSGEGGANDGAAYPLVLLGLALCGAAGMDLKHPWMVTVSIAWGLAGGVAVGWLMGTTTEALVARLRIRYGKALGLEGFYALGLMSACYGAALLVHGYAFLAVFVAGVALRRNELEATGDETPAEALEEVQRGDKDKVSKDPELAHAYLAESMMTFSVELERIVELALMLLVGSVVSVYWREMLGWKPICAVLVLLLVVRPVSAWIALLGSTTNWQQRLLSGWLGIRGVGTFYYLLFALERVPDHVLKPIVPTVLATIVGSVFLHGTSATPLLKRYFREAK